MTLPVLLRTLHRRIAASHTTGGLSVVAAQLGISKQRLHRYLRGDDVPPAREIAALAERLTRVTRSR